MISNSLAGKTALVTGASRGIGAAIAKTMAAQGALVAVHYGASSDAAAPHAAYSKSKLAMHGLTLSLDQELAPRKITVNAIAPGAVATDLIAESRKHPAFEQAVLTMTAFGRLGQPKDIADAALLLVQPEAGWITGQIIEVSGGLRL